MGIISKLFGAKKLSSTTERKNSSYASQYKCPPNNTMISYEDFLAITAQQLVNSHGRLKEVRCLNNGEIELHYNDQHVVLSRGHSGKMDLSIIQFGYKGTGPDCFRSFLNNNGFYISREDIADIKTPVSITINTSSNSIFSGKILITPLNFSCNSGNFVEESKYRSMEKSRAEIAKEQLEKMKNR